MKFDLTDLFWSVTLPALGIACSPRSPLVRYVVKLAPQDFLGLNQKVVLLAFTILCGGLLGAAALTPFRMKRLGAALGLVLGFGYVYATM